MAEEVNVLLDYIPPSLHNEIRAGTSNTPVDVYLQRALSGKTPDGTMDRDDPLDLYLPAGRYRCQNGLDIGRQIRLRGAGKATFTSKSSLATELYFESDGPAVRYGTSAFSTLSDFSLIYKGPAAHTDSAGLVIGSNLSGEDRTQFCTFREIRIEQFHRVGIELRNLQESLFENVQVSKNGIGLFDDTDSTRLEFRGGYFGNNKNHGLWLAGGRDSAFYSCSFQSNYGAGILLKQELRSDGSLYNGSLLEGISFYNCWVENNWRPDRSNYDVIITGSGEPMPNKPDGTVVNNELGFIKALRIALYSVTLDQPASSMSILFDHAAQCVAYHPNVANFAPQIKGTAHAEGCGVVMGRFFPKPES